MKMKRLGIEWGAAHAVAQPVQITNDEVELVIFESERGELVITTSADVLISKTKDGLRVALRG